jgi:hypothetical protein
LKGFAFFYWRAAYAEAGLHHGESCVFAGGIFSYEKPYLVTSGTRLHSVFYTFYEEK